MDKLIIGAQTFLVAGLTDQVCKVLDISKQSGPIIVSRDRTHFTFGQEGEDGSLEVRSNGETYYWRMPNSARLHDLGAQPEYWSQIDPTRVKDALKIILNGR